jgi:hypothetical protein
MITDSPQNRWSDPELLGVRMNIRDTFSGTELVSIQKLYRSVFKSSHHIIKLTDFVQQ